MRLILILVTILSASCSDKDQDVAAENITTDTTITLTVDTLTSSLTNPWGIAFLPDGRILVTENAGEIRVIENGKLLDNKIGNVPEVYDNSQGGLLDIKLHPDYATNGWLYITYSKPGNGGGGTTLIRARLESNNLTDIEELFSAQPFVRSGAHFGSRIVFDGKGYVYISSGERGTKENSQDLSNHLGKIIRLHDDGRIPNNNPFVNQAGARPEIWSYGHRNPQGMFYDKENDIIWAHEHGPQGGDELNRIEKGINYGWPVITYGTNYDGTPITDKTEMVGMEQPVTYWTPSIAPCGMAIVTHENFKVWKGNLLIGALVHRHLARVEIKDGEYVTQEKLLQDVGRVRAVEESPDGFIYVATESPGMLLKLSVKK
ncbi:MAG TPA: PQQ-dependent sugar dehydrogenase [Chryseosolibacter sp.]|nr:PQQ-dependent sugar dehydrogenase [Chryseosolibacter sp.]